MCGRFTLHTEKDLLAKRFQLDPNDLGELAPRYNIAPTDPVLTVRLHGGVRQGRAMRWGLIPRWAKDRKKLPLMINARCETVASRPAYRDAFKRRRCLIPADGFYEWQAAGELARRKHPFWISLGGPPFAIAGIWERWRPEPDRLDADVLESCTLITVPASDGMRAIHDRMPAILRPDEEAAWLDPSQDSREVLESLLHAWDALEITPVSTRVNTVKNDDETLIQRHEEPQLGF